MQTKKFLIPDFNRFCAFIKTFMDGTVYIIYKSKVRILSEQITDDIYFW